MVMKKPQDPTGTDGDSMSQIRDILFGSQFREMQEALQELRQTLTSTAEQLRTALAEQRRALESSWSAQLQRLNDRMRVEQNDRLHADSNIGDQLREFAELVQKSHLEFETKINDRHTELNASIDNTRSQLQDSSEQRFQQLTHDFEARIEGLRRGERATLKQLFQHLGDRLEDGAS